MKPPDAIDIQPELGLALAEIKEFLKKHSINDDTDSFRLFADERDQIWFELDQGNTLGGKLRFEGGQYTYCWTNDETVAINYIDDVWLGEISGTWQDIKEKIFKTILTHNMASILGK